MCGCTSGRPTTCASNRAPACSTVCAPSGWTRLATGRAPSACSSSPGQVPYPVLGHGRARQGSARPYGAMPGKPAPRGKARTIQSRAPGGRRSRTNPPRPPRSALGANASTRSPDSERRQDDAARNIVRTIRSGLSNARLEAVNDKIKTTIKMGYGYRNLDDLIALVMLKCGGLNLQLSGRQ